MLARRKCLFADLLLSASPRKEATPVATALRSRLFASVCDAHERKRVGRWAKAIQIAGQVEIIARDPFRFKRQRAYFSWRLFLASCVCSRSYILSRAPNIPYFFMPQHFIFDRTTYYLLHVVLLVLLHKCLAHAPFEAVVACFRWENTHIHPRSVVLQPLRLSHK